MDEQMQQQIVALVQAAMQGDPQAQQQVQQIMQAAQQGDQQAAQIAQVMQQVAQQMQGQQTQMAKFGAKLNYIKFLKGQCPSGYEMQFFKAGGRVCKKCMKKENGGEVVDNPVDAFKCGRKMKKKACGGSIKEAKCGTKVESDKCGKKLIKKKVTGGPITKRNKYSKSDDGEIYNETITNSKGQTMTKTSDEGGYTIKGFNGKRGSRAHGMKSNAVTDSLDRAWDNELKLVKKKEIIKHQFGSKVIKDQNPAGPLEVWNPVEYGKAQNDYYRQSAKGHFQNAFNGPFSISKIWEGLKDTYNSIPWLGGYDESEERHITGTAPLPSVGNTSAGLNTATKTTKAAKLAAQARKEDKALRINKKTKDQTKSGLGFDTGDARHVNSGQSRVKNRQIEGVLRSIKANKYGNTAATQLEAIEKKIAKSTDSKVIKGWKQKRRQMAKDYIDKGNIIYTEESSM